MAKQKLDLTDERQSPLKVILWLAWPLFLEQILSTLVSFADTAMVGSLGATATASVSISNSFVFVINGAVMALGVGITAYVARSVGARDYEAAKAYIRHALLILMCLGIPLAIASFAMTSIFICLLVSQKKSSANAIAATGAALGVVACKIAGLGGAAILLGALVGVACAVAFSRLRRAH